MPHLMVLYSDPPEGMDRRPESHAEEGMAVEMLRELAGEKRKNGTLTPEQDVLRARLTRTMMHPDPAPSADK